MMVPTVIAIAAPSAVRITHWIASPRSGSSPRVRARTALNNATPTVTSGKTAATAISNCRVRAIGVPPLIGCGGSGREDLRNRGVTEKDDEPNAQHHLRDE